VTRYTSQIAGRREFPPNVDCDPHLVLHGRAPRNVDDGLGPEHRRKGTHMDTERDITIDTDEDHIVRGLD
jgi:hypothetical protein